MRLLLDTQIAIWWLVASARLRRATRDWIAASPCIVSVASIWEVAIKHRLGKLPIASQRFRDEMEAAGATILPISDAHAIASGELPPGHDDPFDRLLVATAQVEHLVLATADQAIVRWAGQQPMLPIKLV